MEPMICMSVETFETLTACASNKWLSIANNPHDDNEIMFLIELIVDLAPALALIMSKSAVANDSIKEIVQLILDKAKFTCEMNAREDLDQIINTLMVLAKGAPDK